MTITYLLLLIAYLAIVINIIKNEKSYKSIKKINVSKFKTMAHILKYIAFKYPCLAALKYELHGIPIKISYINYYRNCQKVAKSLIKLGVNKHSTVGIIGYNSVEWLYSYMGSIIIGAKVVGIYSTNTPNICNYISNNSNLDFLIAEDETQVSKFKDYIENTTNLKGIVMYGEDKKNIKYNNLYNWNDFVNLSINNKKDLEIRSNRNDISTIIYTSGTTGNPKGVIITHKNIINTLKLSLKHIFNVQNNYNLHNSIQVGKEKFISYLPLNHIAAQMLDIYLPITLVGEVYIHNMKKNKNIPLTNILTKEKPTIFLGVPRVWEKIMEGIIEKTNKMNYLKWIILKISENIPFINNLILSKIGLDNCKICFTAAAPLNNQTRIFFKNIGLNLYDIYGLSETTGPITVSIPNCSKKKSVGKIINGISVKIKGNKKKGEILVKGPTVSKGYYPNISNKIGSSEWFNTGDLGYIDKDNFLFLSGRKKEIIITSGGENISPIPIEQNIKKNIPLIEEVVIIGENKKYLTCLLTLKSEDKSDKLTENAKDIVKNIGSNSFDLKKASKDKKIFNYIQKKINDVNSKSVSRVSQIKKFKILPSKFTIESGDMTPTFKLRKTIIKNKYKKYIDLMYN